MARRRARAVMTAVTVALFAAQGLQAIELKIATLAPDGSAWMNASREGAAEIGERTEGRVTLRFYPGGTMGNEDVVLRKIRVGQLHGGMFTAGTLAEVYPDFQIYALPLLFTSYAEVDHVRAALDATLIDNLGRDGFICFGLIEGGFAYLMSNSPTRSFDDLKGQKAWVPEGDSIGKSILEAAGLAPIPLPLPDVLTGLQTGLIDTVAGPPVGAVALQWFTKVKYITDKPIVYTYGSIALADKTWSRLSAADQAVVSEVLGRVSTTLDRSTRADNDRALEALARQGVETVTLSGDNDRRWNEVGREATRRLAESKTFSPEMMARVEGLLRAFREN